MIRVILVDDEILSRVGIQSLIDGKEDIYVEGVFSSAEEGIAYLQEASVDIVITDIEMYEMDGLEFIRIIRERQLADGIIILSCHDDFQYAQQAISNGTDSYMLKFSVTEESLVKEIHKIYKKVHKNRPERRLSGKGFRDTEEIPKEGNYVIGILRPIVSGEMLFDNIMLTNLLEDVVSRSQIGTYFAPYNRENFIVFHFDADITKEEIRSTLEANFKLIEREVGGFISVSFLWGVSEVFSKQQAIRDHYFQAEQAMEQAFYYPDQAVHYFKKRTESDLKITFSSDHFMEADGEKQFQNELGKALTKARFDMMPISVLKDQLIQAVDVLNVQVMTANGMSQEEIHSRNLDAGFVSVISQTQDIQQLEQALSRTMHEFRDRLLEDFSRDELRKAFQYIHENLSEKITLEEMAKMCNMSIPSFSKKFKERTGITLVQYLNEQRIEKAKIMLSNEENSLWEISEATGFSSVNYLVRVFKKVTGKTIGEYRNRQNIAQGLPEEGGLE